ncbi:B12-binding domain-containing radical SAM protein [Clostridium cylindrosporum]|uniref:Fe-S oxidoreductase n=1 Tax=Clostridium cylindrosporum DSM 605 TaxID=1121307 RepID=A0A0J8DEV3_CLOCY|nr:radical SAM protein [Clostridium cylindrosporum]KMT22708.1 Fe-S oxidoreductase [Clostridium cylindrosporum DSM 605]
MRVTLASLNSKYVHSNLAIRYIKAFSTSYSIDLYEATINENAMDIALKIYEARPEVIGFSCYIWNVESTLKVCSTLKSLDKNIKIILGGPEITHNPYIYLDKYEFIDYVIAGEGEISFNLLLKHIDGKVDIGTIEGVYYRDNGNIRGREPVIIEPLDVLEFPYKDKKDLPSNIVYYEASRGCPFSCKYCLSSVIRGIRLFPIGRVKDELEFFIENNVKLVKFVDRTFNANKKFAMEIWKFLIERKGNTVFHFEIAADLLDDEMIELLNTAPKGMFQFEIGVQSTNDEILKNINRVMDFDKVKKNVEKVIKGDKIHCHLDLIAGLPGEDIKSFKNSFNNSMEIMPHVLQLGFLKILKGSPMEREAKKYDMKWCSYPPYQILSTSTMSSMDIIELLEIEKVFENFYNSHIFRRTMYYALENIYDKFTFFWEFKEYLKEKGFFTRSLNLKDKFMLIHEFLSQEYDESVIRDLLLLDFLLNTKKSSLPEFLIKENEKGLREKLHNSEKDLEKAFGNFQYKRLFAAQSSLKVCSKEGLYTYENGDYVLVVNFDSGDYTYLKQDLG